MEKTEKLFKHLNYFYFKLSATVDEKDQTI